MTRYVLPIALVTAMFSFSSLRADDLDLLQGKWSAKKTNDQGQAYTQVVEIKKDKFVFEIKGANDEVAIHAEGDVKLEKLGPFSVAKFTHIRGGTSADSLQDVDDDHVSVYTLDGETWMVTSNFDKEREQPAGLDVYHKIKTVVRTLVIDEIQMASTPQGGSWYLCFQLTVEGVTKQYHLDDKAYDSGKVNIPVNLELPNVKAGQRGAFKMQLDDVDADVCTDDVDNRSTGEFAISENGTQEYKPEDGWKYTIRWHLK
jgi:uncharacterized protein YxeA